VAVYLTDKAEARRAASAQASFPSRRAREKKGVEKEKGVRNQSRKATRNPTASRLLCRLSWRTAIKKISVGMKRTPEFRHRDKIQHGGDGG
jgi:hypothetical protein